MLGNPPWDVSQFSEKEFFAFNNPMIASMEGEERKLAIDELEATNPEQFEQYVEAKRKNESFNQFYQKSLRYSLQEKKINLYSLFTELCYFLKNLGFRYYCTHENSN